MEFNINKKTKILVVTPHQDDETIGCGGFLAKFGKQCDVLLLTDGGKGIEGVSEEETTKIRDSELNKAMSLANINKVIRLNIKNNELNNNKKIIKSFNIKPYDMILVPNRKENHCDHYKVFSIFRSMKFAQGSKAIIYEYEVWTPLTNPTNFLDISGYIDIKKKMLSKYVSQNKNRDYLNSAIGLNRYRGLFCNHKYAEAYMNSSYNAFLAVIYNALPESIKKNLRKLLGGQ